VERKGSLVHVFRSLDEKPFAIIGPISKSAALSVEARPGEPFVRFTFGPAKGNTDRRLRILHFPMIRLEGLGDPWELRVQGTAGLTAIDGHPGSFMYLAVAEPVTRDGVVCGWLTSRKGSGVVKSGRTSGPYRVIIDPELDYGNAWIPAGREVPRETFVLGRFADCRIGLEAYAELAAAEHGKELPPQIAGYTTWYAEKNGWSGDAASTRVFAEAAERLLGKWGFEFFQIDARWQAGLKKPGCAARNFTDVDPEGPYKEGMKPVADALKARGIRAGLWFFPFTGTRYDPWWQERSELFLKSAVDDPAPEDRRRPYQVPQRKGEPYENYWAGTALDMSRADARDYLKDIVRRFTKEWGYSYLKFDGMWGALGAELVLCGHVCEDGYGTAAFTNPETTGVEATRLAEESMREAAGPDTFILGCNLGQNVRAMGPSYGIVDAMRIGPDNGPWIYRYMNGVAPGTSRYFFNGRLWYNDPDPVYLRTERSIGQARLFASWTSIGGMLYNFSDWLPDLPPERLDILRRTLAPHRVKDVRPVDYFENECANTWRLAKGDTLVYAFCNWSTKNVLRIDYAAAYADLDPERTYVGFDFWENEFVPPFSGRLQAEVKPVDCRVRAIRAVEGHPVLISTSRHVASPAFDVQSERWDSDSGTLSGEAEEVPCIACELRFYVPRGWDFASAPGGDAQREGRFLRVRYVPENNNLHWTVNFKKEKE